MWTTPTRLRPVPLNPNASTSKQLAPAAFAESVSESPSFLRAPATLEQYWYWHHAQLPIPSNRRSIQRTSTSSQKQKAELFDRFGGKVRPVSQVGTFWHYADGPLRAFMVAEHPDFVKKWAVGEKRPSDAAGVQEAQTGAKQKV